MTLALRSVAARVVGALTRIDQLDAQHGPTRNCGPEMRAQTAEAQVLLDGLSDADRAEVVAEVEKRIQEG